MGVPFPNHSLSPAAARQCPVTPSFAPVFHIVGVDGEWRLVGRCWGARATRQRWLQLAANCTAVVNLKEHAGVAASPRKPLALRVAVACKCCKRCRLRFVLLPRRAALPVSAHTHAQRSVVHRASDRSAPLLHPLLAAASLSASSRASSTATPSPASPHNRGVSELASASATPGRRQRAARAWWRRDGQPQSTARRSRSATSSAAALPFTLESCFGRRTACI